MQPPTLAWSVVLALASHLGRLPFLRHPLYLAEEVAIIGSVRNFCRSGRLLVIVHIACQIRRMRNEEIVLTDVLPEYSSYGRKLHG